MAHEDIDTSDKNKRLGHANLNIDKRKKKAAKVTALLSTRRTLLGCNALEVGAGSGANAHALHLQAGPNGRVCAVDVSDQRIFRDGYEFKLVDSTLLPFEDHSFDIVVSNHVIEHVGGRSEQVHHLKEIARTLKSNGLLYLAAPNKWAIIEPHFRLPFLSYLPLWLANIYVRATGKGVNYDCDLPSLRILLTMLDSANLIAEDITREAFMLMVRNKEFGPFSGLLSIFGNAAFKLFRIFIPTNILLVSISE